MKTVLFAILFPFIFFIAAYSQDVQKSAKTEKINGKEYYIHTVKKGETVWKIAKAYGVSPDDIISENPGMKEKIKPKQIIKIPVKQESEQNNKINLGIDTSITGIDTVGYDCGKPMLLNSYNIALMLPLYLDNVNQIEPDDPDIKNKDADNYTSLTFVQYYEGILLALDSLKKKGFSARIYVYDVDEDTAAILKILDKPELSKMHLIIGPFFENSMTIVTRFAKKYSIKVVDPVLTDDDILKGNPNMFRTSLSIPMQLKQLAAFIVKRYPDSPLVIVHNNKDNEKYHLAVFKTALNKEFKKAGKPENKFKEVVYNTSGITGITQNFSAADTNIVITLSNGEIFVTNYMSRLNDIYDKYKMIVFGLPSWKNFDNIETEYMQNIHLHLFSSSFIDYMDDNVKSFIQNYRDRYKTEPDKYAFHGYDDAMFFFNALKKYGVNFDKCLDKINGLSMQSNYKFVKTGENDGFENTYLNIYRYEGYKFINARKHPKIIEQEEKKK